MSHTDWQNPVTGADIEQLTETLFPMYADAKYLDRGAFRRKYGMSLFTAKQRGLVPMSTQRSTYGRPQPPREDTSATTYDHRRPVLPTQDPSPKKTVAVVSPKGTVVFDLDAMVEDAARLGDNAFKTKYGINRYYAKKSGLIPWETSRPRPDDPHCWYCGAENPTTQDHVVPKHLGGSSDIENLVWACEDCNARKKTHTLEIFREFTMHRWGLTNLLFYGEAEGYRETGTDLMYLPKVQWRKKPSSALPCCRCARTKTRLRNRICMQCQQEREDECYEINFL